MQQTCIEETALEKIVLDAVNRHIEHVEKLDQLLSLIDKMEIKYDDIIANDQEILQKYEEQKRCREMEILFIKTCWMELSQKKNTNSFLRFVLNVQSR